MRKTYESLWHNPETDLDLVIARGSSEEYVSTLARLNQFVPFTVREYQSEEDIRADYKDWRKENGNQKPNRVIVKMHWEDGDNTEKGYQIDTIGIVPLWKIGDTENVPGDSMILFYVSSIQGLLDLMQPDNGSDFVVDEVLEFYKM
jgi:hypothetical protein